MERAHREGTIPLHGNLLRRTAGTRATPPLSSLTAAGRRQGGDVAGLVQGHRV